MEVAVETLAGTEAVMYVENLVAIEVVQVKIVENLVLVEASEDCRELGFCRSREPGLRLSKDLGLPGNR